MQNTQTRPDATQITNEGAIEVVERFFDALRAKDLERALTFLSDDIEYQNVPFPAHRGRANTERALRMFARIPGDFGIRVKHIAERGGVVLTERVDSVRGPWADLDFWVCGTFQVRGGKIVLWRDYFDLTTITWALITSPIRRLLRAREPAPARA